jgi:hypothetical protein
METTDAAAKRSSSGMFARSESALANSDLALQRRAQMRDLWQDDGGAGAAGDRTGDDDWDEGEESLDASLEDGFDDPDGLDNELEDEDADDD